jgi:hypothetical protein
METLTTKFFSFLFLTMFGGGWTVPLGLPPAKEDPALARVAPEKCLFYANWAGMAPADAKSKNQTEQLLAEPEVQRSFAALATLMSDTVLPELANSYGAGPLPPVAVPIQPSVPGPTNNRDRDAVMSATWEMAKIIATHPGAVYVTNTKIDKRGARQEGRGGMIVAAGQDAEKLRAAFDQFRKLAYQAHGEISGKRSADPSRTLERIPPKGGTTNNPPTEVTQPVREVHIAGHTWYRVAIHPTVICGFQGTDFIVGVGDDSVEEILERRKQQPPAWLADLRKQLPVERVSTVVYLNLKLLLDQITADTPMPKTREAMRRLGLDNVTSVASVSGLDGETFTSKLLLSTDGEPQGLLRLFSDQPLRADDLKPIPADSTLSLAMRFDAEKVIEQVAAMMEAAVPGGRAAAESQWDALTKALEIDLRRELPKALGDSCCVYVSPGEGGLLVLGLTAVVPIKDRRALSAIQLKLVSGSLGKSLWGEISQDQSRSPRLQSCDFAGRRIFYVNSVGIAFMTPALPAWCLTDRELIVAMTPQNVMAYLQHGPGYKSLATVPQVGRLIDAANGPSTLAHVDTAKVFELAYPLVTTYALMGLSAFHEEHSLPLHAIPSAPAIRRHLVPGTAALRRTKHGLELISRQPLPGTGLLWTAALLSQSPQSLEQQVATAGQPKPAPEVFFAPPAVPQPTMAPAPAPPPGGAAPAYAPATVPPPMPPQ